MPYQYGIDRYLMPIVIDGDNQDMTFEFGTSGTVEFSIPEGTYWGHTEEDLDGAGSYPGLYEEIEAQVLNSGVSINIDAATPPNSDLELSGLKIICGETLQIDFGSSTVNPRWFGVSPGTGLYPATAATNVTSEHSRYKCWQSYCKWDHRGAMSKWRDEIRMSASSSEDTLETYEYEKTRRRLRRIRYSEVPALHIWEDQDQRGSDAAHVENAGLPDGDQNNALETLWESMKDLDDIVLMHDGATTLFPTIGAWEIVLLNDKAQRDRFSAIVGERPDRPRGEYVDFTLDLISRTEFGDYTY